jgi:LPS O-antigen subunit length determinant protein (WzzB/FepE family)
MQKLSSNIMINQLSISQTFSLIYKKIKFIYAFTIIFTFLAILYASSLPLVYETKAEISAPSDLETKRLNSFLYSSILANDDIFKSFLSNLTTREIQKKIFLDNDFISKFNPENKIIINSDKYIHSILKNIRLERPNLTQNDIKVGFLDNYPYTISMSGENSQAISEFLTILINEVNVVTLDEFYNENDVEVSNRLDTISIYREKIVDLELKKRLHSIEQWKDENLIKIAVIKNEIINLKYKYNERRLNIIEKLTEASNIADALGIIENNFDNKGKLPNSASDQIYRDFDQFSLLLESSDALPVWFFYGQKALNAMIESLEKNPVSSRSIEGLIDLELELSRIENDPVLEQMISPSYRLKKLELKNIINPNMVVLEEQSPYTEIDFFNELSLTDTEINTLSQLTNGSPWSGNNEINTVKVISYPSIANSPVSPNKLNIILLVFFGSLLFSTFLGIFIEIIKNDFKKMSKY